MRQPELSGDFSVLMGWADKVRRLGIRAYVKKPYTRDNLGRSIEMMKADQRPTDDVTWVVHADVHPRVANCHRCHP